MILDLETMRYRFVEACGRWKSVACHWEDEYGEGIEVIRGIEPIRRMITNDIYIDEDSYNSIRESESKINMNKFINCDGVSCHNCPINNNTLLNNSRLDCSTDKVNIEGVSFSEFKKYYLETLQFALQNISNDNV